MCGIVGIIGREDPGVAKRMADRIRHRGPDGEGIWSDANITLGHRRLSIIDVEDGAQPMESHDGRYVVVYNGEIYNHQAIRAELERLGHTFHTDHSDTEVILEAYRAWGPAFLEKLEGMFAFLLYDTHTKELLLARDPFGIKPMFYGWTEDGALIFGSEIKALMGHDGFQPTVNHDRIKERLAIEFLRGQGTLFHGLRQLPPGTYTTFRVRELDPGMEFRWMPFVTVGIDEFRTPEEAAHAIHDRFVQSVDEQLMSDVPLGVILSGGLDSAAVAAAQAAIVRERSGDSIQTFTIAESDEVEDFQRARQLADHLGSDHKEFFFDTEDILKGMPRYTLHNENINYTEFFFQPLFAGMKKSVTVGLCGQGSDELWGGYSRYRDPRKLATERLEKLRACPPADAHELSMEVLQAHRTGSSLAEWDQQGQLNNFQLRLVDRNSMHASLEVRVPFLSKPLWQASRSIGWGWKIHQGIEKWVLRKAFEPLGMPDHLTWRPKVPAGRATAPKAMDQYEAWAAKHVDTSKPLPADLHCGMKEPVQRLQYRLFEACFVHRRGELPANFKIEDLL